MVIGKKVEHGVQIIVVILADGEFLPDNLNHPKVVVFRQGESTGRQLKIVKELGAKAPASILRPPTQPVCNYSNTDGNPLHEHTDGTWWFYDQSWNLEQGPYAAYETAEEALTEYCIKFQQAKEEEEAAFRELTEISAALKLNTTIKDPE
jgi:hypothetical protein